MCAITLHIKQACSNSSAGVTEAGQATATLWGGGYYDNDIDGNALGTILRTEWDVSPLIAYLRFDVRLRNNLLVG